MGEEFEYRFGGPVERLTGGVVIETRDVRSYEKNGYLRKRVRKTDDQDLLAKEAEAKTEDGSEEGTERPDAAAGLLSPDASTSAVERSFDDLVEDVIATVLRHPKHRPILRALLDRCTVETLYEDAEQFVLELPEYPSAHQSARTLIRMLVRAGGLRETDYDEFDVEVTDERRSQVLEEGGTEDDVEDLTAYQTVVTTEAGLSALERLDPVRRTREKVAEKPEYAALYSRLLGFIEEAPRTLPEIEAFVKEDSDYQKNGGGLLTLQPSYFIDALDVTGAISWRKGTGWSITEGGRAYRRVASADEQDRKE